METKTNTRKGTKLKERLVNVLISNCSFHNLGDVLMVYALDALLRKSQIKYNLLIDTKDDIDKKTKKQLQIEQIFINHPRKLSLLKRRTLLREISGFSRSLIYGIPNIDLVFDLNGYFLSDTWGYHNAFKYLEKYNHLRQKGAKIIFLPKSFGPFENEQMRGVTQHILALVDLIYARDPLSLSYLQAITKNSQKIRLGNDYTTVVEPILRPEYSKYRDRAAIIVNYRMVDKTGNNKKLYVDYIAKVVRCIRSLNLEYFVLLQDKKSDPNFVDYLIKEKIIDCDVVTDFDPRALKGLASLSKIVFSSRYHGILNALNTKTPVIGTAWTHKYNFIADFYDIGKYIVDISIPFEELYELTKTALQMSDEETQMREKTITGLKLMSENMIEESIRLLK